jgi:hypothetical protein
MKKGKKSVEFYDVMQFGLELEGAFWKSRGNFDGNGIFTSKIDGSVNDAGDGYGYEIVSGIIKNKEQEEEIYTFLESISKDTTINGETGKAFADRNATAGTHIHIGLQAGTDEDLVIFDSAEFEEFFFLRYFSAFNLQKFAKRLRNSYCQRTFLDVRDLPSIEDKKSNGGRYWWLNVRESLNSEKGIEFRIFPFLISSAGVREVVAFTQNIVMEYWNRPKTAQKVEKVRKYNAEIKGRRVNIKKLNDFEKIVYNALKLNRGGVFFSMDCIEFLVGLYEKKPSAFQAVDKEIF